MITYVVKRLGVTLIALFGISIAMFALLHFSPGDPASMYFNPLEFEGDREAAVEARREALGLDKPLPVQYVTWLGQVLQGNLGFSYQDGRPVAELLGSRIGATAWLMITGTVVALTIGLVAGVLAALKRNTMVDYTVSFFSVVAISVPSFFVALTAIYFFGLQWGLLPTAGMNSPGGGIADALRHLILPAGILGVMGSAGYVRWSRSSMLDVLGQDFLVTAKAKGLSRPRVVVRHGLRNALIPLVTIIATSIPGMLGGSVIIEQIFAWPGTGRLVVDSIANRDYPILMGFLMLTAVLVLLCNLLADVAYAFIDPRIRL